MLRVESVDKVEMVCVCRFGQDIKLWISFSMFIFHLPSSILLDIWKMKSRQTIFWPFVRCKACVWSRPKSWLRISRVNVLCKTSVFTDGAAIGGGCERIMAILAVATGLRAGLDWGDHGLLVRIYYIMMVVEQRSVKLTLVKCRKVVKWL